MCDVIDDIENESVIEAVREKVTALCRRLPVYEADLG